MLQFILDIIVIDKIKPAYMWQANFFATFILTNVSFLIIENIPLLEVPLRRALLVNQKGHKFGIFSIAYEENEDLYKMSSKNPELWHIYAGIKILFINWINHNPHKNTT